MFGIQKTLRILTSCTLSVKDVLRSILIVKSEIDGLGRSKNSELIVIGNGPSLSANLLNDKKFFNGKDAICCNEFAQSDHYEIIKPKFYLFYDPAYWRKTEVQKVNDDIGYTFKSLKEKTTWPIILLINISGREWNHFMELERLNENIKIIYFYNNNVAVNTKLKYYLYKKNKAMPFLYNVLGISIFFGLNLGYKKIYLLGADHSWHKDLIIKNDNKLYWKIDHFYDQEEANLTPIYVDSYCNRTFKMHEILASLSNTFKGYFELEDYSHYLNSKIYNATKGSCIDAFERFNIDEK